MANRCTSFNPSKDHLRHCAECQRQMAAHIELLKFVSDLPASQLSADFNAQLLQKVKQSRREKPVTHANFWIKSYWVLATILSLVVLFRVKLPPVLDNPWLFPLSLLAIVSFAVFPFLAARHARRIACYLGLTAN